MEMTYVYAKAPGEGLDRLTQLIMDEDRVQHFERKERKAAPDFGNPRKGGGGPGTSEQATVARSKPAGP